MSLLQYVSDFRRFKLKVDVQELSDPSKVVVSGPALNEHPVTFRPTKFTIDCTDAGPGLYSVAPFLSKTQIVCA